MEFKPPPSLKRVPSNVFDRGFKLAKLTAKLSVRAVGHSLGKWAPDWIHEKGNPESLRRYLGAQASLLTNELGQLKGSVMKAGQLLSTYGEHFLPPEVNQFLKSLQSESTPLEWSEIEKVLKRELGKEKLDLLEIDPTAWAAASLGQVHRAKIRTTGEEVALKIQYPGVDRAIETDLAFLRLIFQITDIFPTGFQSEPIMNEIRQMLTRELDYNLEFTATKWFHEKLESEPYIQVPKVYEDFSTRAILTTEFIASLPVDDIQVRSWPQSVRNKIAELFLSVYMCELFEWGRIQTDPHFGNYRVRLSEDGNPILVLLDFGAVREISPAFQSSYHLMVSGAIHRNADDVLAGGSALGFIQPKDPPQLRQLFVDLCFLITEPFVDPSWNINLQNFMNLNGEYDWGISDLPQRVARLGAQMVTQFQFRTPPQEVVFIDRKLGGTFTFLSNLNAVLNARPLVSRYL
jgi:predicted unusual protein kinase regulating ubiquinone biosynthesis (AarF/ABC1/UbiB family)